MTDTFRADDSSETIKDGQTDMTEPSNFGCKGVAISLHSGRRASSDEKEGRKNSPQKQETANDGSAKPLAVPKVVVSPRTEPQEITDPWNASDRGEKTPIQRLKKLATEISQTEDNNSQGISPLENFIRNKVSSKSSAPKKGNVPFIKDIPTNNAGSKRASAVTSVAKKQPKKPLINVGSSVENKFAVKVEAKPPAKTASQRQKNYNIEVGLPFSTSASKTSKKQLFVTKVVAPHRQTHVSKAVVKGKKLLAKSAKTSQPSRTTIKRKEGMREPTMLQAVFSNNAEDFSQNSNHLPFAPVKNSNRSVASKKISVAPTEQRFGVLVEIKKLKDSRKEEKNVLKNGGFIPMDKAGPVIAKQQDNKVVEEQATNVEKIISLAQDTINQQAKELESSTFKPVVSGVQDAPLDSSKTLFSIAAKSKPQKVDSQELHHSSPTVDDALPSQKTVDWTSSDLSSQDSSNNKQHEVEVSVSSSSLAGLLADRDVGSASESPTIILPDFAGYSGGISNSEQQDTAQVNIAFNTMQANKMNNDEEQYWAVPVESLGSGVANALGNAVGGVVHIGKVISGNSGKKHKKRPAAKAKTVIAVKAPLKRGQQVKEIMANKVGSGVGGIITGVGQMAKGGANVVVGTLGCLGGALVCLSGAKVDNKTKLIKK
jgi:hypothetical protein